MVSGYPTQIKLTSGCIQRGSSGEVGGSTGHMPMLFVSDTLGWAEYTWGWGGS